MSDGTVCQCKVIDPRQIVDGDCLICGKPMAEPAPAEQPRHAEGPGDSEDVRTWNSPELLEHFESCCYDRRVDYVVRAELLRRLSAAQPVPGAKVEEIAREIAMLEYQAWNHVPEKVLKNSIEAIAAILRPYFSSGKVDIGEKS